MPTMVQFKIHLDPDLAKQVKAEAGRTHQTASYVIRELVRAWVEKTSKKRGGSR